METEAETGMMHPHTQERVEEPSEGAKPSPPGERGEQTFQLSKPRGVWQCVLVASGHHVPTGRECSQGTLSRGLHTSGLCLRDRALHARSEGPAWVAKTGSHPEWRWLGSGRQVSGELFCNSLWLILNSGSPGRRGGGSGCSDIGRQGTGQPHHRHLGPGYP